MKLLLVILILYFIYASCNNTKEGLSNRLTNEEKKIYTKTLLDKKSSFTTLQSAKDEIPWMDPVLYEDARKLIDRNKFDANNINLILS